MGRRGAPAVDDIRQASRDEGHFRGPCAGGSVELGAMCQQKEWRFMIRNAGSPQARPWGSSVVQSALDPSLGICGGAPTPQPNRLGSSLSPRRRTRCGWAGRLPRRKSGRAASFSALRIASPEASVRVSDRILISRSLRREVEGSIEVYLPTIEDHTQELETRVRRGSPSARTRHLQGLPRDPQCPARRQ